MAREIHKIRSCLARINLVSALALLTACSVGPKYMRPSVPVPPAYKELGSAGCRRGCLEASATA